MRVQITRVGCFHFHRCSLMGEHFSVDMLVLETT